MDNLKVAAELLGIAREMVAGDDALSFLLDSFGGVREHWEDVEMLGDSRYSVAIGQNVTWRKWYGTEVERQPQIWEGFRSKRALLNAIEKDTGLR